MPSYPYDAACGRSGLDPSTWDDEVAGETERQRTTRHNAAAGICDTCPVALACYTRRGQGGGIRAGIPHKDRVPGWTLSESNSWIGWSRDNLDLHGNEAGMRRHYRDGSKPCMACLAWSRRNKEDDWAAREHAA